MGLFDFFVKKAEPRPKKSPQEIAAGRKAFVEKQITLFNSELDAIPRSVVCVYDDAPNLKNDAAESCDFKFSRITDRRRESGELAKFVTIDVETSSLNTSAAILEISAMRFENYEPKELYTSFIKPNRFSNTPRAYHVNGIAKEMISDAPRIWQVIPSLSDFIGKSNIVGHNLEFDLYYLCRDGLRLPRTKNLYDTMSIARSMGGYEDYQLSTLCSYGNIFPGNAHHSHAECLMKGKLFKLLVFNIL